MRIVKWGLKTIAVLILIMLIAASVVYLITESHRNRTYRVDVEPLKIDNSAESIELGKHVATIRGCIDCHGGNLEGAVFIKDPIVGQFIATNLTSGEGGIGSSYTDEDLIKAIRHGVNKQNKSVIFMPSHEYNQIDSKDLSSLIAYIRNLEPVDNELPDSKINLPYRLMYLLDSEIHLFPAKVIDHNLPVPEPVAERSPAELGKYLAATCTGCHGSGFSGGKIPGVPPDWPVATNLTPAGSMGNWTADDFLQTMRTGITPEGRELPKEYMPWQVFGTMTDEELQGLFAYFQSLPAKETGNR